MVEIAPVARGRAVTVQMTFWPALKEGAEVLDLEAVAIKNLLLTPRAEARSGWGQDARREPGAFHRSSNLNGHL